MFGASGESYGWFRKPLGNSDKGDPTQGITGCHTGEIWLTVETVQGSSKPQHRHQPLAVASTRLQAYWKVVPKTNKKPDAVAPGSHKRVGDSWRLQSGRQDSNLRHLAPKAVYLLSVGWISSVSD